MTRRPASRGFSLIEVVAAMAIGAASLAALLPVFGDGARRTDRAAAQRLALLVAQSALAGAGADGPLTPGAAWTGAGQGMVWHVAVDEYGEAGPSRSTAVALRLVQVEVRQGDAAGPVLATLRTLKLATPPSSGPQLRGGAADDS